MWVRLIERKSKVLLDLFPLRRLKRSHLSLWELIFQAVPQRKRNDYLVGSRYATSDPGATYLDASEEEAWSESIASE